MALDIRIHRESDVPIHEQVAAQIVLSIGSGALRPGDALPSIRGLARRLGVHRNTVTQAYRDYVLGKLVVKRRGSRLVVRDPRDMRAEVGTELDEFVNSAIRAARQTGYSLQQLIEHLRDRLLAAPPDHILLISDDASMRILMPAELSERFSLPIQACSTDDVLADRDLMLGALLVTAPGNVATLEGKIPVVRPVIPVTYSSAEEHLSTIRRLEQPSLIVVASISEYFLEMACGVLVPAESSGHSLRRVLITSEHAASVGAADLIFCDSCAYRVVRNLGPRAEVVRHQLISPACFDQIEAMLDSRSRFQKGAG